MFYNGVSRFIEPFFTFCVFFLLLCKIITGQFSLKFDYMCLSDSIPLLNIVSSPVFTILIFYICMLYVYILKQTHTNVLVSVFLVPSYYWVVSSYTTKVNSIFTTTAVNLTLQNGLLNIHPYIIYQLYGFICVYVFLKMLKIKTYRQYYLNTDVLKTINLLILIGIILGAWWAAQEFNWGGFWSWDPVELISLLLLLFIVNLHHKNLDNFSTLRLSYYITLSLVIYCIMRLGLVSTIHSFIKNTSIPYYIYCIFIGFAIINLCFLFSYLNNAKLSGLQNQYTVTFYFMLFITILSIFLINLILVNFNVLSYYVLFSLSTLYCIILTTYVINILMIDLKFSNVYISILILSYTLLYYYFGTYVIYCFIFVMIFLKKKNWILHTTSFALYLTAVYFFDPLTQNYKTVLSYLSLYSVTDIYINIGTNGLFLSNFYIKKNIFMLTLKNYVHHGLGFVTYTKYIISQFLSFKNNSLLVVYSEEFIFVLVLIYILICLYNYIFTKSWNVINY